MPSRSAFAIVAAVVVVGLQPACFVDPVNQDCIDACEAENACPGEDPEPCDDLCRAVPEDCVQEHMAYWGCAAANIDQACSAFTDCGSELADMSTCITAYCLVNPFSSDCYY
jgi:hypothetical protein